MATIDELRARLQAIVDSPVPRVAKAESAAEAIRGRGGYRWVGLYDVLEDEIAVIGWAGPTPPTYPRFPRTKGLNGAAVASRIPVIVQDVSKDERYLTTLGDTRGEFIMPVDTGDGTIVGTIDVESGETDAFSAADRVLLEESARILLPLWEEAQRGCGPTTG